MMMKPRSLCLLVVALASGFLITHEFARRLEAGGTLGAFEMGGLNGDSLGSFLTATYGFAMTIIGVGLGGVYRRLLALKNQGVEQALLRETLSFVAGSVDFQLGVVGAPVIFGLIWQGLGEASVAGLTIIALQNGFSANAIIAQVAIGSAADE